jgi:hypothetical protein
VSERHGASPRPLPLAPRVAPRPSYRSPRTRLSGPVPTSSRPRGGERRLDAATPDPPLPLPRRPPQPAGGAHTTPTHHWFHRANRPHASATPLIPKPLEPNRCLEIGRYRVAYHDRRQQQQHATPPNRSGRAIVPAPQRTRIGTSTNRQLSRDTPRSSCMLKEHSAFQGCSERRICPIGTAHVTTARSPARQRTIHYLYKE